jgi:glucose/arabinose dehydrogenase
MVITMPIRPTLRAQIRWLSTITMAVSFVANSQAQSDIRATVYASGFAGPVAIVQHPTSRTVQFVVEQTGRIRVVDNGQVLAADFLDLRGTIASVGEQGLLGLAFAPDYATSGRVYLNFTNAQGHTVVARIKGSASNPFVADPGTRFDLRWNGATGPAYIAQPYANHNGGHLVFGPDGYLYVGMGDGGGGNDPENRAQNPAELLGKMLRVDVNVPDSDPIGYRIPADNPFVLGVPVAARGEIWAFGLRNPWRFNFDSPALGGSGAMLIADVGQTAWEEVDYEPPARGGRNYGWRIREGAHPNVTTLPPAYTPLVEPIFEYAHNGDSKSISGGYVYRGTDLPSIYRGRYFFADFVDGHVYSIGLTIDASGEARAVSPMDHTAALSNAGPPGNVSSFGLDASGELFIVSYSRGQILRVMSNVPKVPTGLRILRSF